MALFDSLRRHARGPARRLRDLLDRLVGEDQLADEAQIKRVVRLLGALDATRATSDLSDAARQRIENRLVDRLFDGPSDTGPSARLQHWAGELAERARALVPAGKNTLSAGEAADHACQALAGLTEEPIETVLSITAHDNGWAARIQTLEARRVPATEDILSVYDVALDHTGRLAHAERAARVLRGASL